MDLKSLKYTRYSYVSLSHSQKKDQNWVNVRFVKQKYGCRVRALFLCGRLCCADCIATEELCIECYEEEETAEEDLFQ